MNHNYLKKDMVWPTYCILGMPSYLAIEWVVIVPNVALEHFLTSGVCLLERVAGCDVWPGKNPIL